MSAEIMSIDATPELLERIAQKKEDMTLARRGMKEGIKYSSRSLGGHTTQYRRLCRLAGIKVAVSKPQPAPQATPIIGKPCRYKKCKGRSHKAHGEKCPIASARGKTGGEMGEGENKQRLGSENGNFRTVRECGCPVRQHRLDCKHASHAHRKDFGLVAAYLNSKNARVKINVRKISWLDQALTVSAVAKYLYGVTGVCSGCDNTFPANRAIMVHRADITQNPARVVCEGCN